MIIIIVDQEREVYVRLARPGTTGDCVSGASIRSFSVARNPRSPGEGGVSRRNAVLRRFAPLPVILPSSRSSSLLLGGSKAPPMLKTQRPSHDDSPMSRPRWLALFPADPVPAPPPPGNASSPHSNSSLPLATLSSIASMMALSSKTGPCPSHLAWCFRRLLMSAMSTRPFL